MMNLLFGPIFMVRLSSLFRFGVFLLLRSSDGAESRLTEQGLSRDYMLSTASNELNPVPNIHQRS